MRSLLTVTLLFWANGSQLVFAVAFEDVTDRVRGLLIGSLIGDAAGGPVEFKKRGELRRWLPDIGSWTAAEFREQLRSGRLAEEFRLLSYAGIRDEVAAYGPWEHAAAAGTITDDSRHKMILMHALRPRVSQPSAPLQAVDLCRAYTQFIENPAIRNREDYRELCGESLQEYTAAARWLLGDRDPATTFPPQRLWAGIATCSGQMTLLPVAAIYPGDAEAAYRASYALNFVDVGQAKDICSALIAGLATAIASNHDSEARRWQDVLQAIRSTDPYRYDEVPFAQRPATEWLDFALMAAQRADGKPAVLFEILEQEGRAKYYWDAHFTYASAIAFLKFADFRPREAMLVSLAFGHDTDSAAQLIGALGGAVLGTSAFPESAQRQVGDRLRADYDQDVEEWTRVLMQLANKDAYPRPIQFLDDAETTPPDHFRPTP